MIKKDRIDIDLVINNNPTMVKKWFEGMILFEPQQMRIRKLSKNKRSKYKQSKFFNEMEKEILNEEYIVSCYDQINDIQSSKDYNSKIIKISAIFDIDIYKKSEQDIINLIDIIMMDSGIVSNITILNDWFFQNTRDLDNYRIYEKSLEGIPVKESTRFKDEMIVDVEKLPGYDERIDDIWFGVAWKMWFNKPYYEFISKDILENFQDCFENRKVSSDCINITLYEDMEDYDNPKNRELQWKFKDATNFNAVLEKYRKTGINRVYDPTHEIKEGDFEHGGIKLTQAYFDAEGNNVHKSQAVEVRIAEIDKDGKVVWKEKRDISDNQ